MLNKYMYKIETNMVKKRMLFDKTRQYNIQISIKLSFSSIGQENSKLLKQISKVLILIELAA